MSMYNQRMNSGMVGHYNNRGGNQVQQRPIATQPLSSQLDQYGQEYNMQIGNDDPNNSYVRNNSYHNHSYNKPTLYSQSQPNQFRNTSPYDYNRANPNISRYDQNQTGNNNIAYDYNKPSNNISYDYSRSNINPYDYNKSKNNISPYDYNQPTSNSYRRQLNYDYTNKTDNNDMEQTRKQYMDQDRTKQQLGNKNTQKEYKDYYNKPQLYKPGMYQQDIKYIDNSLLKFECVGGGFMFYEFNKTGKGDRQQQRKKQAKYKIMNYQEQENRELVELLIEIILLEQDLNNEKDIYYQQNKDSDYLQYILQLIDKNKDSSVNMQELKNGMEKIGVYNVLDEDLRLLVKNYSDGTSQLSHTQLKNMLLPRGKDLKVSSNQQRKVVLLNGVQQSGLQQIFKKLLNVEVSVEQIKQELNEKYINLPKIFDYINDGQSFNSQILLQFIKKYDHTEQHVSIVNRFDEQSVSLLISRFNKNRDSVDLNQFLKVLQQ